MERIEEFKAHLKDSKGASPRGSTTRGSRTVVASRGFFLVVRRIL